MYGEFIMVRLLICGTVPCPFHAVAGAQQQSQQQLQQGYKGLGVAGDLSSRGDLYMRDADVGKGAIDGSATDKFAAAGVAPDMASDLQSITGGLAGDVAAGRAGASSLAEPAKAVSTDGDIIGTAVKADALKAAAEGSTEALPGERAVKPGARANLFAKPCLVSV